MVLFAALRTAVQGVILLAHHAPLIVLGKGAHLQAYTTAQREPSTFMSLQTFDFG